MEIESKSPAEIQIALGERMRALRLRRNLTQAEVASSAGVARRSLFQLEGGHGSSLETLVRVLKALGVPDILGTIASAPQISPLAMLRAPDGPKRASRSRKPRP
jgi:transcriptional regulator with XRE-family HTH domain